MAKSLKDLLGEKKNPYLRSKADQKFAADFTSDTTIKKDRATEHEGNFKALGVKSVENEKERHGFDTPDDNADGTDLDPGTFKNLDDRLKKYKKYTNIAEQDGSEIKEGAWADLQRKRKKEAKTLEKNTDTSKAEALGMEAFKSGKKRIPSQHKEFADHLAVVTKGKPIGHGLPHLTAWIKGWDKGNLNKVKASLKEDDDPELVEGVITKVKRFLDKVSGNQQDRILKKSRARQDAGPFGGHKKEGDTVRSSLKNYYRGTDTERVGKRYMSGGKKDGGPLFYHSKNGKKTPIYEEDLNEASKAELLSRYASQVKEVMVEISGLLNDYVKHQKNGYYIDFYNIKSNLSQLMDIRDSLTGSVESAEKDAENKLNSAQSISKSVYETYTFSRTKSPAKDSKRLKRIANNAEKKAADEAEKGKPWSMSNVRMHQNMMADALKQRSEVIKDYLAKRKTR